MTIVILKISLSKNIIVNQVEIHLIIHNKKNYLVTQLRNKLKIIK